MLSVVIFAFGVIFIMAGWWLAVSSGEDPKRMGLGTLILCLGYSMFSWAINMTIKEGEQNRAPGPPSAPAAA